MATDLYPLTFEAEVLTKVWGGDKLTRLFNKPESDEPKGESWEVSDVEGNESVVDRGPLAGQRLDELQREHGAALVGELIAARSPEKFPLLLKLIDADDDLSVQVHPDAEQAARLGGSAQSKNEAWLILQVDPGAKLVHGVTEGLDRQQFERLVAEEKIEQCLRFVEVSAGDVVPVPPGTLHAIGKGVVLLELQESSDTTYRFWDWGRVGLDGKPRQLHVEQALAVVSLDDRPPRATPQPLDGPGRRQLLHQDKALVMQRWELEGSTPMAGDAARCWLVTTLSGSVTIASDSPVPSVTLPTGRSALIPAGLDVTFEPDAPGVTLFLGTVPD